MKRRSGFAMVVAMVLMAVLAVIAVSILALSAADRRRAIRSTRTEVRESCAFSGMTFARTYFGNHYTSWNTYFATPGKYDPMNLPATSPTWGSAVKADLSTVTSINAIKATNPELFLDLDNDGQPDAYIFIRDNFDEYPPSAANFQRDNDQNAIVGAVCISSTMLPKRDDNSLDTDLMLMESLLSVNQSVGGGAGPCIGNNLNNCS